MGNWSDPTTTDEASRRAAGRRRYNYQRQVEAIERQIEALNLATRTNLTQVEIAQRLGVSKATICRYLKVAKGGPLHVKRAHNVTFEYPPGKWSASGYWY